MEIILVAAISAALSLAALVALVILAWRQRDIQAASLILARRQTDIQARVAAIEGARRAEEKEARRRARVSVRFDRSFPVLCLINDGPAAARGVTVEVRPIGNGEPLSIDLRDLPVDLRPSQQLYLEAQHPYPDGAVSMTATVHWTDETGIHNETFVLNPQF